MRVVEFYGSRNNRDREGGAKLSAGASYPRIGEPRPENLRVGSCVHGIDHFLHEPGDPDGGLVWFAHADDDEEVEQQVRDVGSFCEQRLLPRLDRFDDPRELRDALVARDLTSAALPLCDLLGDRDWTVAVLRHHLVQTRLDHPSDGPPGRLTDWQWVSRYATAVDWSARLSVRFQKKIAASRSASSRGFATLTGVSMTT